MIVEYAHGVDGNFTQVGQWPFPHHFEPGHEPGKFDQPTYIAIAKHTGNVPPAASAVFYISDSNNNRIQKFRYEPGEHTS